MVTWPEEWKIATIGEVFNVSAGGDVDKLPFSKVPTPIYKYEVFSNGVENRGLYGYSSKALYPANSLTVSARGTIGRTFYRDKDFNAIIRLLVLTPKSKNVDARFYSYYIDSQVVFVRENTGVAQLTVPRIKEIIIPIPPLEEQHAIADTLSAFDRHISALSALIAKKQAVRQGALEDLMTGRTRLEGFCGSWKTVKLGECADIVQGGTPSTTNPNYWGGNIIWVTPSEITRLQSLYIDNSERKITQAGLRNSSAQILPAGTILLCSRATIGELAIAAKPMTTNQGFKNLICRNHVNNVFFAYMLMTLKKQMISLAAGTTFLELSKSNLETIEVNLPTLDEQLAISSVLSALDSELSALNSERSKFSAIRQAAISDLLTGKIRLERTTH